MTEERQLAHRLAQRDLDIIQQVIEEAEPQNYDIKHILLCYEDYLRQQNLAIERDSLIYKTLLKMSLITRYKIPTVYSISSVSSADLSTGAVEATWEERLEMAYEWLYYDHLFRIFRRRRLEEKAFRAMHELKQLETARANSAHQNQIYSLSPSEQAELQAKSLKSLLFERIEQQLEESHHVSQLLKQQEDSDAQEQSFNEKVSEVREEINEPEEESAHSLSRAASSETRNSATTQPSSRHISTVETAETDFNAHAEKLQRSFRSEHATQPYSLGSSNESDKAKNEQFDKKPSRNITLNDSFEQFLKEELELDQHIDQRLKSVTSLELTESEPKDLAKNSFGRRAVADTIDPTTSAAAELQLSKHNIGTFSARPSASQALPQTQSSFMVKTPEQLQTESEAVSIIAAIDVAEMITADQILQICAFKNILRQTIEKINKMGVEYAFSAWKIRTKQVICCRLRLERSIVRFYVVEVFDNMRKIMHYNTSLVQNAQGVRNHMRNILCLRALKAMQKQTVACQSRLFNQNSVRVLLEKRALLDELIVLEEDIVLEHDSAKFVYFKQKTISQLEQQILCLRKQLHTFDKDESTFYRAIQLIRRNWLPIMSSIAVISDKFYDRTNSVRYFGVLEGLHGLNDESAFAAIFSKLEVYMVNGYEIIPAACHTLRRPIDYLNFLYACSRFEAKVQREFIEELAINVSEIKQSIRLFVEREKFAHWRRSAEFRRRMQNIDQFVTDYYETKILRKRALSSLLMEAGHRKLIAFILPRINARIQRDALAILLFAAKERKFSKYGFLQDVDKLYCMHERRKVLNIMISRYNNCEDAFYRIKRLAENRIRRFAFSCVMQATAVALFRKVHVQRFLFVVKRSVIDLAWRLKAERDTAGEVVERWEYLYTYVAFVSAVEKYRQLRAAAISVSKQQRMRHIGLPFIVWRMKTNNLTKSAVTVEHAHLAKLLVATSTFLFGEARLLFKCEGFEQQKHFRLEFEIMYAMKQTRNLNDARRRNALAYCVVRRQQTVEESVFVFWRGFAKLSFEMRQIETAKLISIFRHWHNISEDKAHFVAYRPRLERIKQFADLERRFKEHPARDIENLEAFIDVRSQYDSRLDRAVCIADMQSKYAFIERTRFSRNAIVTATLCKMLSCFRDGVPCIKNDFYLLKSVFGRLEANSIREKDLHAFCEGLRCCLDTTLKRATLRALNEQRIKEIRLVELALHIELRKQRDCLKILQHGLASEYQRYQLSNRFSCAATQRIAFELWQAKANRGNAIAHYIACNHRKFILRVALFALLREKRRVLTASHRVMELYHCNIKRLALECLKRRCNTAIVAARFEVRAQSKNKAFLRVVFRTLIQRANQFIQFHNDMIDKTEHRAFTAVVRRFSELQRMSISVCEFREQECERRVFSAMRSVVSANRLSERLYWQKALEVTGKLFNEWRKCSQLSAASFAVQALRRTATLRTALFCMLRKREVAEIGRFVSARRDTAIKLRIMHGMQATARKIIEINAAYSVQCSNSQKQAFECIKQRFATIKRLQETAALLSSRTLKLHVLAALKAHSAKMRILDELARPVEDRRIAKAKSLALGTWAVYSARMQAVRLARDDAQNRRKRVAFNAISFKHDALCQAASAARILHDRRLMKAVFLVERAQTRYNTYARQRLEEFDAEANELKLQSAFKTLLCKNSALRTAEAAVHKERQSATVAAVFYALVQRFRRFEAQSDRADTWHSMECMRQSIAGWARRSQHLELAQQQVLQQRKTGLLSAAFVNVSRMAKLSRIFRRARVRIMLLRWHAEIEATKLNMHRAGEVRKADAFVEKRGRMLTSKVFEEIKLIALKVEQMQRAADAFFWADGKYFHVWREAAWAKRRRARE